MQATICCVDVGHGDATVAVDHESGLGLIVDCRAGHHLRVVEELRRLGVTEVLLALVTHSHADHFGGVLDVIEELGPGFSGYLYFNHDTLMAMPLDAADRPAAGQKLRALLNRAYELAPRLRRAEVPAEDLSVDGQVGAISWSLLAPSFSEVADAIKSRDPNKASGVVVLAVGEDNVVIGGDAQMPTWNRIKDALPKDAIVRWPHHGGAISSSPGDVTALFELLEPAVTLVSVGATNTHGHPSEEFFAVAGGKPGGLYCTQATPACVAGGGAGGVCAGTIRVTAAGDGRPAVAPEPADHSAVVAAFGNGRCLPVNMSTP